MVEFHQMKLTENQLKQLADFTSNLSLVFFASVLTPLFSNVDSINIFNVLWGTALGLLSIFSSLIILRGRNL